ncbi:MAG TPA: AAA family ATPase [Dissulfurispiraceae bacterium]
MSDPDALDKNPALAIPPKLYGREGEQARLVSAFERFNEGASGILLVSGYSGIGKTSLVLQLREPVEARKGRFISGKYDPLRRDRPYSAIIQAFQGLIRQILTESAETVRRWKEGLVEAFGVNGRLIIDMIPEIELIAGRQPEVPPAGPAEAQNRFNRAFRNFIKVFARPGHPLVIFLDDLQWADRASLSLIEALACDPASKHLLLIMAYRDNEMGDTHPLRKTLERMQGAGKVIDHVSLSPLGVPDIVGLLSDTFACRPEEAGLPADAVYRKTSGNPFFVHQFLGFLHNEGMLRFEPSRGWKWDLGRINAMPVEETMVDLLVRKIGSLPSRTREVMKAAACLGSRFDLRTLGLICGEPETSAFHDLFEAIREGLVLSAGNHYKFAHDRVREAFYSLIPEGQRAAIHYGIGKTIWERTDPEGVAERIFPIVDQVNLGLKVVGDPAVKLRLAGLNLIAGRRAKGSTAYASAAGYLSTGMGLLPGESWRTHYPLTYDLHMELSECKYLLGDFDEAEQLFGAVLRNARTAIEKAGIYKMKVALLHNAGRSREALEYGNKGLKLFGYEVPLDAGNAAIMKEALRIKWHLRGRSPEDLNALPDMSDPLWKAIIGILTEMAAPAFFIDNKLYTVIMLRHMGFSIRYGNTPGSSLGYIMYGVLLGALFGDYGTGYEFGQLAVKLSERFSVTGSKFASNYSYLLAGFITHWKEHIGASVRIGADRYPHIVESGDFIHASYCAALHSEMMFFKGDRLDGLLELCGEYLVFMERAESRYMVLVTAGLKQAVLSMKGLTGNPLTYSDDEFDEQRHLQEVREGDKGFSLPMYYIFKLPVLYLFGGYVEAFAILEGLNRKTEFFFGLYHAVCHNFYHSLTLAALYEKTGTKERKTYRKVIAKNQKRMKKWKDNCPENFLNKYQLVSAEIARLEGRHADAERLYEQSIRAAGENKFIHEEGIANERAAEFYLSRGMEDIAARHTKEACFCYERWGASAKVKQLRDRYPKWFAPEIV